MSDKEVFKFESVQDNISISDYFQELIKGLKNGDMNFRNSSEQITLRPQGMLNFAIKIKKKDHKVKMDIELDWKENTKLHDEKKILEIKV